MRNYDLSVLINASEGEDAAKTQHEKLNSIIDSCGGRSYASTFHGRIDLVKTFKKHSQAFSIRIQYSGNQSTLDALSKEFKINEQIIRHLNTSLESVLSPDEIKALTN